MAECSVTVGLTAGHGPRRDRTELKTILNNLQSIIDFDTVLTRPLLYFIGFRRF